MSAPPFRLGQAWRMKARPEVTATINRLLSSRERRRYEAWGVTPVRYEGLAYPFPAADAWGRGVCLLVTLEEWEVAP